MSMFCEELLGLLGLRKVSGFGAQVLKSQGLGLDCRFYRPFCFVVTRELGPHP